MSTTVVGRRRWGLLGLVLVLLLAVAACSSDDPGEEGTTDDSTPEVAEGEATGPTVAPGDAIPAPELPEIPDPPPIPAAGEATLELAGEPIEVVLNRCEHNPNPEIGLDVTMNPPTASETNPAGLVLLVPDAQPGLNLVDAISAALQLEGDPTFLPLDGRLDLADDLLSGTLVFGVQRGDELLVGTAAFSCASA